MLGDDATKAKQESVGEVGKAGFRAGGEWAERGGVLRRTQAVCATFLCLEKAVAGSSHAETGAGRRGSAICGSETGGRGKYSRGIAAEVISWFGALGIERTLPPGSGKGGCADVERGHDREILFISSKRRRQSYDPRTRATACNAAVKSCLVRAPIE